jgi:osmotically-inducible protein OsmY
MADRFSNLYADDAGRSGTRAGMMAAEVSAALHDAFDINASGIKVSMLGSFAVLEGHVFSRGDMLRAIEIAEEVAGEGKVRSRLSMR